PRWSLAGQLAASPAPMAALASVIRTVGVGPPLSANAVSPGAAAVAVAPGQIAGLSVVTLPAPVIVPDVEQANPWPVTIELRTSSDAPVDSTADDPVEPVKVELRIAAVPAKRLATSLPPTVAFPLLFTNVLLRMVRAEKFATAPPSSAPAGTVLSRMVMFSSTNPAAAEELYTAAPPVVAS